MQLPFSEREFFDLFEQYNAAIGRLPPIVATVLAFGLLLMTVRGHRGAARIMLTFLAAIWLWNGLVYHGHFFVRINPVAHVFAGMFVLQATLLAIVAATARAVRFELGCSASGLAGACLVGYALVIYPIWCAWLGHAYPHGPIFGVTPCPTTLFTFGTLIWLRPSKVTGLLLVVPTLWAVIGTGAVLRLGVVPDLGLPVASAAAVALGVMGRPMSARRTPE